MSDKEEDVFSSFIILINSCNFRNAVMLETTHSAMNVQYSEIHYQHRKCLNFKWNKIDIYI